MILHGDNKACKIQYIGMIILKMFDVREFLLHNMTYVPELKKNLLFISIFDDLGYWSRVEHRVLKILYGDVIIDKNLKYVAFVY